MTLLPALFTALLTPAQAAEVTELAPMLRGDVQVRYDLDAERGRLMEAGDPVGRRALTNHQVTWSGSFSFYSGAALFVEMPYMASERVRFDDATAMTYDPILDRGTLVGSDPLRGGQPTVGSGLGGTWVGLRGAPYHQDLFADRGDRASLLFEAAWRFQDDTNFWTYGPRGERGGGAGAPAFRLRGAFSTQHRSAEPYLAATWTVPSRIRTDVVAPNGRTVAQGLTLRPASEVELLAGAELNVHEYQEGGALALDFRSRFGYRSWQDIPSGLYLPSVLDASEGLAATESDYVYLSGSFGLNWRIVHYLQWNVSGEFGVTSPRRIEHFYPVSTGMGTHTWGVTTALRFRVRDDLFEKVQPAPL